MGRSQRSTLSLMRKLDQEVEWSSSPTAAAPGAVEVFTPRSGLGAALSCLLSFASQESLQVIFSFSCSAAARDWIPAVQ